MTTYNEEQALANHTEAWRTIARLRETIQRLNKRIKDLSGMVSWLQNRVAELEEQLSAKAQAERHFK